MFSGYYLEHKVLAGMERSTITQVVESTLLEVASLESMLFFFKLTTSVLSLNTDEYFVGKCNIYFYSFYFR